MVLLGGTMYGTMSSFVKLSFTRGYNAAELSFWQALLAAVMLGLCTLATRKHKNKNLLKKFFLPLMFTGCSIGLTNFLYYDSVSYIPASVAIIILMQYTWFSLLIEWIVFRRKASKMELITVFFILIGTLLAGKMLETKSLTFSLKGIVLALCSSLTYSIYIIANGRIGKSVRWQAKSMTIMIGSSCSIFVINSSTILSSTYLNGEFMLWAIFLAIIGTTIPTALFAAGISKIGAGMSSILMTIELPVAILCANLVLNEPISPLQIAGILIMLLSICTMNYYKLMKSR